MKKILLVLSIVLIYSNSYSQLFNKFSIAAGPVFGWNVPSVSELNNEMKKVGIPEFSSSGVFGIGGAVFVDVPFVKGLRIGYMGYGFSDNKSSSFANNSKNAEFSFSSNSLSVEYVKKLGGSFDWSVGGQVGIGSTSLKLANYSNAFKEWNIGNYLNDTNSSGHNTLNFKTTSFTVVPQAGLGFQANRFLYFKLNAGYLFTVNSKWKADDIIEINNFPSGIKSDGLIFNLGVYVGLFID